MDRDCLRQLLLPQERSGDVNDRVVGNVRTDWRNSGPATKSQPTEQDSGSEDGTHLNWCDAALEEVAQCENYRDSNHDQPTRIAHPAPEKLLGERIEVSPKDDLFDQW